MVFDVSLPLALFLITLAILFLYAKYEGRIRSLLGGKELRLRDVILLVVAMGLMVTIIVFIPQVAILVFFLSAYSLVLFLFTYLISQKWYLGIISPALFISLYLLFRETDAWNIYLLNLFAVVFAIFVSIYLGSLFTWKTTAAFVTLLTLMDIIHVFGTKFMPASAEKAIGLQLPMMIVLSTFPSEGRIMLGLGDIFLFGLLAIQTTQRYGRKFGLTSVMVMTVVFLLLETVLLNFAFGYFPATVMVICGWLAALGIRYLYESLVFKSG
ncbi:MAG: hypothetical protein AOA65_0888 [Candidatus Bathyarchaeota archaeon BA1]|nr:MAG: hypothetical protein AOA65_0888 [Candidatus Bathyarchaeota archaeon BA1]